jgi:CubicO group peptidase (beta-lactamase class C family)
MDDLDRAVDELATRTPFSGVVRIDRHGRVEFERAYGQADRGHDVPNRADTQFGIASGSKGLTALTVMSMVEHGSLQPGTTARSVLGNDLPLIGDAVTVEQLLAHRSGIGDYLDEDTDIAATDHVLPVPVHELATTEDYLHVLDGHPAKFDPGERFAYSNGGYVVLALIAERTAGLPFDELVRARVCVPAGMIDTAFLRSDELPGRAALGYLAADGLRTNVLHLPVRGSGDGGVYSTAADLSSFWTALVAGSIVALPSVRKMTRPRSLAGTSRRYGLGFWLHASREIVMLEGSDAGVSFRSAHDPGGITYTVISNTTDGAWAIARLLERHLGWLE